MAEVKPGEISAILREQLAGLKTESDIQEVGTILQVGDGIARIYGISNVQSGELIEFENGVIKAARQVYMVYKDEQSMAMRQSASR